MHTDNVNSVFPYVSYCQINPVSRCFIGSCRLNWTIIFHLLSLRTIHRVLIVREKQQNHTHTRTRIALLWHFHLRSTPKAKSCFLTAYQLHHCGCCLEWHSSRNVRSCRDVQATPMNEWATSIQRMKRPNDLCGRFLSRSDRKPARTHLIPPLLHPAPPPSLRGDFSTAGGGRVRGGACEGQLKAQTDVFTPARVKSCEQWWLGLFSDAVGGLMIPSATSLQDYDFGIMSDYVRPPEIKKNQKTLRRQQPGL